MKRQFKPGDVVVCIAVRRGNKKRWSKNWTKLDGVKLKGVYRIECCNPCSIDLENTIFSFHLPKENFRLATAKEKKQFEGKNV